MSRPATPQDWARLLKDEWSQRARSPVCDFFVASGPSWDDPDTRARMAKMGAEFILTGLDPEFLSRSHLLEIGCGTGRLVPHLRSRVRDYTGIDISAEMVEEARRRCHDVAGARFFECDGLAIPDEARDRLYDVVLAFAVFIHCPKDVIGSLVSNGYSVLAPGGRLRFQVYADIQDLTGLDPVIDLEALAREAQSMESSAPEEVTRLIEGRYYEGHRFRYAEARTYFEGLVDGSVALYRQSPLDIWVDIHRPER